MTPSALPSSRDLPARAAYGAALLVLLLVGLWLRLRTARPLPLNYDEVWHSFASSLRPLDAWLVELREVAHPPLYLALSRAVLAFSQAPFAARLVSLLCGVAAAPLLALCARRMGLSRPVSLLAALCWTLLPAPVVISILNRGYSLATTLLLGAFAGWLPLLRGELPPEARPRALRAAALLSLLAMGTEYCALFALLPIAAVPLLGAFLRQGRDGLREAAAALRPLLLAVLGGTLSLGAYLAWSVHLPTYDHVTPFMPGAGPLWRFVLDGATRDLRELLSIEPAGAARAALPLVLGALLLSAWRALRPGGELARGAAALTALGLTAILIALAVLRRYPFGGYMRHQFVLFPFLLLALLERLDAALARLTPAPRGLATAGVGAAVSVLAASALRRPLAEDFGWDGRWWTEAPAALAGAAPGPLYVSNYTFFALSGSVPGRWTALGPCGEGCRRLRLERPGQAPAEVLRDTVTPDEADLGDAALRGRLRAALCATGAPSLLLYSIRPGAEPITDPAPAIVAAARQEGLTLQRGATPQVPSLLRVSSAAPCP